MNALAQQPIQKKLNKICWYSKSVYPGLDGSVDPSTLSPAAVPYRDVSFNYDYELAQNTPNSSAPSPADGQPGKGRLTLKTVQFGGNQNGTYSQLPAYVFAYQKSYQNSQGQSDPYYNGPADADPWGYKDAGNFVDYNPATGDQSLSMAQRGVLWNLNQIINPSGGMISVAYGRDSVNSGAGAMYATSKSDVYNLNLYSGQTLKSGENINFFVNATNNNTSYAGQFALQDDANLGNLNSLITGKAHTYQVCAAKIAQSIPVANFLNQQCVFYRTQKGTVYYTGFYKIIAISNPIANNTYEFTLDRELYNDAEMVDGNGNPLNLSPANTTNNSPGLWVFAPIMARLGDVRVSSLTQTTVTGSTITTSYSYGGGVVESIPVKATPYLPYAVTPSGGWFNQINKFSKSDYSVIYPWVKVSIMNNATPPVSVNGSTEYDFFTYDDKLKLTNKSALSWSYDSVPVYSEAVSSSTTFHILLDQIVDRSGIVGQTKSVELFDNSGNLKKKTINHYLFSDELANNAQVVYKDLANPIANPKRLGMIREHSIRYNIDTMNLNALTVALQSVTDVQTPHVYLAGTTDSLDGVQSVSTFLYFDASTGDPLVTIKENSPAPIGGTATTQGRMDINVPYHFLATANEQNTMTTKNIATLTGMSAALDISSVITGDFAAQSYAGRLYTDVFQLMGGGIFTPPGANPGILYNSPSLIAKAGLTNYTTESFSSSSFPYAQSRMWTGGTYSLQNSGAFDPNSPVYDYGLPTPQAISGNWLQLSQVTAVDRYARPLCEIDAANGSTKDTCTAIYLPNINAPEAVVSNANYDECAAFTCDYDEQENAGYFDYENRWEKGGGSAFVTMPQNGINGHFTNKCVSISLPHNNVNTWGPGRNIVVHPGKDYIMSAWVYVTSGTLAMSGDYRSISSTGWTTIGEFSGAGSATATSQGKWQYIQLKIPASTDLTTAMWAANPNGIGVRVYVGSPYAGSTNISAYIDDIRFYPANALMSTFYYDQNLQIPVAFVDANNKAKYYGYDAFGRLTSVQNNAGQVVKTAVYYQAGIGSVLQFFNPINNEQYTVGAYMPIAWTTYGPAVSYIDLSYSSDNGNTWNPIVSKYLNSGSYNWPIPGTMSVNTPYLIKVSATPTAGATTPSGVESSSCTVSFNPKTDFIWKWILNLLNM